MKTILELCAGLPATEGELRERGVEFNRAVAAIVHGAKHAATWCPIDKIRDAKAATDAILLNVWLRCYRSSDETLTVWECEYPAGVGLPLGVCVRASTEELVRSAAALLAASAIALLPHSDS